MNYLLHILLWLSALSVPAVSPSFIDSEVTIRQFEPSGQAYEAARRTFQNNASAIFPEPFDKQTFLILYLQEPARRISLSVTDPVGRIMRAPMRRSLPTGFYEISVLPDLNISGVFTIQLIVDDRIYYRQLVR